MDDLWQSMDEFWQIYERKKKELWGEGLSPEEYERRLKALQTSRSTYGVGCQYRYIEGLWDNVYEWV